MTEPHVTEPLSRSYTSRCGTLSVSEVDPRIFIRRFYAYCMQCTFCHDHCCQFGCEIDAPNAERLARHAGGLEPYVRAPRAQWFEDEAKADPDDPETPFLSSRVIDGLCAFASSSGRGCGIHAYCLDHGLDYHDLKPLVCWLFPLAVEAPGLLGLMDEVLDDSLICLNQGITVYRGQRAEVLYLFGPELIVELDEMERRVAAGEVRTGTL